MVKEKFIKELNMPDNKNCDPTDAINSVESTRDKVEDIEDKKTLIKKGYLKYVNIYEVSESELTILESGSPNSIYCNLFIFFLTTLLSFLTTLLTTGTYINNIIQIIFIVIATVSGFSTVIFFILWLHGRKQFKNIIDKIKERII
jgi:hypothetical protein